jgi:hypothetical protein
MTAFSFAPSGGSKGHSAPAPAIATPSSCSGATPLHIAGRTATASLVDSLAKSVSDAADHLSCSNELEALIDIATFKDKDANFASSRAELRLLMIYSHLDISVAVRRDMIEQLVVAQNNMLDENSPNADAFAMPASLLHLTAQYARTQIANGDADVVIAPTRLEDIKATLVEATNLLDENIEGRDIADPARLVSTDEILAAFWTIPCGHSSEINLSEEVCDEQKRAQIQSLMNSVDMKGGVVAAPLFIDGHFMLMTIEKNAGRDKYKYNLTIANTNVASIDTSAKSANRAIQKRFLGASIPHRRCRVRIHNAKMQEHAANSCGPLISLLANHIDYAHKEKGFSVKKAIVTKLRNFEKFNAQQQKDIVMAQRSKMIGDTVVYNDRGRFIFPPPSSFAEVQGEVSSL